MGATTLILTHNELYSGYLRLSDPNGNSINPENHIVIRTPPPLNISQDSFLRPHLVEPALEVTPRRASWFSADDLEQLSWYRNGILEHARLEEAAGRLSDEIDRSFMESIANGIMVMDGQLYKTAVKSEEPEPYFTV